MMDFSNFIMLREEIGLVAIFLILLVYDIFSPQKSAKSFQLAALLLLTIHTAGGFFLSFPSGSSFGGMYIHSEMTTLMKSILNIGTLLVFMQSGQWLRSGKNIIREREFYVITLGTLLGMYFMVSAGHFMMLYIGIEMASLPMACLVAYNKYQQKSAEAGAKYILISALSSGIMMFGISYLYGATGSMYFSDMAVSITGSPMIIMGFIFFFAGLAFKISLVPFHQWTADVYEGAPTSITAYLSVVSKGSACFALIFSLYRVFGTIEIVWHHLLWGLSVLTIVVGNLFALRQKEMKRFFAFSSISQAGYILLGIMSGTAQGMMATVYYILVYLFSNMAAFGVINAIENQSGQTGFNTFNGLYKNNPKLALVMTLAVFSLAGIPPFGGFFSKYVIFSAAAANGEYLLVFIALLNTVLSLYYYLLVIKAMFINPVEESSVTSFRTDNYNRISLILCSVAILTIGLLSGIYESMGNISFGITIP